MSEIKLKFEYTFSSRFNSLDSWQHNYTCVGRKGGINLHIIEYGEKMKESCGVEHSAGIEYHWSSPPKYKEHDVPDHNPCWLLKGPCWHDGSTMYAEETLVPSWLIDKNDHKAMFRILRRIYMEQFVDVEEEEDE